ncbi:peptidase M20 [Mycolicibacterium litorale]|uniref:Peptidase M20 domain-containing protein 2 n=1 Tax=Mycolicibacterium litorale TaxID=758802 RepID=A0A6S6P0Z2_9MYCO|nr:peptidase M20 [Mycolicibacterium litorale]
MTSETATETATETPTTRRKRAAQAWLDRRWETIRGISTGLHADPETAWREVRAHRRLTALLESEGFSVDARAGGLDTAFHATAGAGHVHVAFVAEYDALPGLGHACGHNLIAAASVGAALMVRAAEETAPGLGLTVHVIGTPAEEGGGGKILMLEAGQFAGIDAAMMMHPGPADAARAEPFAVAHWEVTYRGVGAHAAAYPHLGVNAADGFTVAQVAIGLLRQHLPATVRVHGVVTEAGTAPNAIPELAVGRWYVRAASLPELDDVERRIRACFEAGATATGCELEIRDESPRYSEFRTDEQLLDWFIRNAAALGRDMTAPPPEGAAAMKTASTDMGNVSQHVRAIHPYLGIGSLPAVNHQRAFADAAVGPAAERALRDGATALAWTAIDFAASNADR